MLLLPLLSLPSPTLAILDCSRIHREPQKQPRSYLKSGIRADRHAFENHDSKMTELNESIPPVCQDAIRIATFNVHYLRDLHDEMSNVKELFDDIAQIDATVLVLQEVKQYGKERKRFETGLKKFGYDHVAESFASPNSFLGNVVYSRQSFSKVNGVGLGHDRTLVEVVLAGEGIHIFGTHLEVGSSDVRLEQTQKIIQQMEQSSDKFQLITGDFNAHWNSREISNLKASYHEAFGSLGWPYPKYTCWAGTSIDFIFVNTRLKERVLGAYLYHTTSSDHLPIIVDILKPPATSMQAKGSISFKDGEKQSIPYCLIIIGGVILLASFVSMAVWLKRRSAPPK